MPKLRESFRLRLLDVAPQSPEGDDEIVQADVRDVDAMTGACVGVRAVVHLAAEHDEADFRSLLLPKNIDGTWSAYETAVRARTPRFVFASSVQAVGPASVYGCTKVFGEALGRYHADHSGLGVACLRMGAVRAPEDPASRALRSFWCGAGDLARLLVAAVLSDAPFALVHAVSPPATERFDTSNPFGWTPCERPAAA